MGTSAETDNDHFDIERSLDGKNFTAIGTVKGKGSSDLVADYQFTDQNISQTGVSMLFYRLLQVDKSGHNDYSMIRTVSLSDKADANITAFPVPFTDNVTLKLDDMTAGSIDVLVYNTSGKLILRHNYTTVKGTNLLTITQLNTLPAGVYTIQCVAPYRTSSLQVTKQ